MLLLFILGFLGEVSSQPHFPYRQQLSAEIRFWKQIFTHYGKNDVVVHDSRYPYIIYKIFYFDPSVSERQRTRKIKHYKKELAKLLKSLEIKQYFRANLSPQEHRILKLFAGIDEAHKFLKAARRIRAQQGIREQFEEGIVRSGRYLPFIRTEFRLQGLPEALIYLPHLESSFNPAARSHVGAAGLWQFMRRTGRRYLKINRLVDERLDPFKSTRAAAKILKYNFQQLQDWALAITAYNYGLSGIKRAVKKLGPNYVAIRQQYLSRRFGFASRSFYSEFLAIVEIMDSLHYYFPEIQMDNPLDFHVVKLRKRTNLKKILKQFGINVAQFRELNPSLRKRVWRGYASLPAGYEIRFPIELELDPILLALGYDVKFPPIPFSKMPGQKIVPLPAFTLSYDAFKPGPYAPSQLLIPENYQSALIALNSQNRRASPKKWANKLSYASADLTNSISGKWRENTSDLLVNGRDVTGMLQKFLAPRQNFIIVAPTETLSHIAECLHFSVSYLRRLNGYSHYQKIYVGGRLRVEFSRVSREEFLKRRMEYHQKLIHQYVNRLSDLHLIEYTIQPGENLWQLAYQKFKFPLNILFYFNNFDKLRKLNPGETIYLPLVLN